MFGKKSQNHETGLSEVFGESDFDNLPPPGKSVVLPFFAALLLGALLVGQYIWFFQPAQILQSPYIRPLLEQFCTLADCKLPRTRNLSRLEVVQRYVDRHGNINKALQAHILFQNNAFFAQPYPSLELRFFDEHKKTVAARRFAPEDYLDNLERARSPLPPNQPVHVKLEFFETVKDMHTYGFEINFL